jgi:hypothetical protein
MWNEGPPGSWMVHSGYWDDEWIRRVGRILGKAKDFLKVTIVHSTGFVVVIGLAL